MQILIKLSLFFGFYALLVSSNNVPFEKSTKPNKKNLKEVKIILKINSRFQTMILSSIH